MRNTTDVSAFSIPLVHNSAVPPDSCTKASRIDGWKSFTATIDSTNRTIKIGAFALIGGVPCLSPGEGPVVRIWWSCPEPDTLASIDLDTTLSTSPAKLLITDCVNPPNKYVPAFEKGTGHVKVYLYGDANKDCAIDIGDPVYLIQFIFTGGLMPVPYWAGDANGDCAVDIGDPVYLIRVHFRWGAGTGCLVFSSDALGQVGCGQRRCKLPRQYQ